MTDSYRYPVSTSSIADRVKSKQYSYSNPSTSTSRYYTPRPTYSPFGSSTPDPRQSRPEVSSYFTDDEVVSGNVRVPRQDTRVSTGSSLGDYIRERAQGGSSRSYGGYTPATYGSTSRPTPPNVPDHATLSAGIRSRVNPDMGESLGEMIRARAQSGASSSPLSGIGGMPGIAPTGRPEPPRIENLPSMDMGQSIRDRVMSGINSSQPSYDPRTPGAGTQSSDGAWGVDQGGYEDAGYTPAADMAPDQGQAPPPMDPTAPVDPGMAPSTPPEGGGTLGSWGNASIDQWDGAFINASEAAKATYGVAPEPSFIKAMMDVETGGNGDYGAGQCRPSDSYDDVPACGPMQIKFDYHRDKCSVCDSSTVEGQIQWAAEILASGMAQGMSQEEAFTSLYFPGTDYQTGTTQASYLDHIAQRQAEQAANPSAAMAAAMGGVVDPLTDQPYPIEGGLAGAPVQESPVSGGGGYSNAAGDPVSLITQGFEDSSGVEYGFRATASDPSLYDDYGEMWPDPGQHPGSDLSGLYEQDYASSVSGIVTCGGSSMEEPGTNGWGCSAFGDTINGATHEKAGRLEVYNPDNGISYIFGHSANIYVDVGDEVQAGDIVGQMGWPADGGDGNMYGHVHYEARIWCNGPSAAPTVIDPIAATSVATEQEARAMFC